MSHSGGLWKWCPSRSLNCLDSLKERRHACVFRRKHGTGPVLQTQLTWFSVELTAWAQSFQSSSVAGTTTSTVLEAVETKQRESPARRVSRAPRRLCFRTHPKTSLQPLLSIVSGARSGSGRAAGPGDGLPGGPTPPPADLRQRGELPVLLCSQDELALRTPAAAALLLTDHEPRPVRFPT